MLKFSFRLTLLSAALALLAVSAASALLPPSEDYQPTNPYWNGLASFFTAANASPIDYPAVRTLPENTVLFIIGPSANVTEPRVEALKQYLLEGGTLVLMDETGAVNPILSGLGIKVSVDGHPMLDPVFYYGSWRLPKIIKVARGDLTLGVENIALDLPSILNIKGSGVAVLAYSSSFSFLDLNGDSQPSAGEPMGPFPVAATATYGEGRLIVISDSSIFLNGVIGLGDNLKLLHNIAGEKKVYVDVGVWQATPQLAYKNTVLAVYGALTAPELKYGLALIIVTVIRMLTHKEKPTPSVEGVDELLARHPGWDRRLLEALKEARQRVVEHS
jgi:hypothetical protein